MPSSKGRQTPIFKVTLEHGASVMRSIGWVLAMVIIGLGWLEPAAALEMAWGTCGSCAGGASCEGVGFAAPPCAAPCYGGTPGCCRCAPSPCDNAWDGYCEERAFWRAIWHAAGTRRSGVGCWSRCQEVAGPYCPPPGSAQPGAGMPPSAPSQIEPPVEPVPGAPTPPVPEPAATKTSWRWSLPWAR